ncbi:hypothetical protein L0222_23320 [bacterium]|nr:hypothetical protein [bacterium]MCI0602045.1 hypothetical protein [bacterium]
MTSAEITLLDEILPDFDVAAKYTIRIQASPEQIFNILQSGIPTGTLTRLLMLLRRIPRIFRNDGCADYSFYKLKQSQGREIVIGIIGQFWKPAATTIEINSLDEFMSFQRRGFSKAALNLRIVSQKNGSSLLSTETRVVSYGSAKDKFGTYWRLIKPFSGMIRREILRKIKKQAEAA